MGQYTPGPWRWCGASERKNRVSATFLVDSDGVPILQAEYDDNVVVSKTNAYLIAAAPDLLEACKSYHKALDVLLTRLAALDKNFLPSKSGEPWDAVVKGKAAMEKAEVHG